MYFSIAHKILTSTGTFSFVLSVQVFQFIYIRGFIHKRKGNRVSQTSDLADKIHTIYQTKAIRVYDFE